MSLIGTRGVLCLTWTMYWLVDASFVTRRTRAFGRNDVVLALERVIRGRRREQKIRKWNEEVEAIMVEMNKMRVS